jgi:hypothetical protein
VGDERAPAGNAVPAWAVQYDAREFEPCSYTADVVGLAVERDSGTLHALLIERGRDPFAGLHAWPGGFVELATDQDSRAAALRELREETGQTDAGFLEMLGVYDQNGRDPRQFAGFPDPATGAWVRRGTRVISAAHLALMRRENRLVAAADDASDAFWAPVYDYLPWEDRRTGGRAAEAALHALRAAGRDPAEARRAFGEGSHRWNEELVAERYHLLHEAGVLPEARRNRWGEEAAPGAPDPGRPMAFDHRRILADALGRVRGKVKYAPSTLDALVGGGFTLDELQRAVEGIAGRPLHRANFRRSLTRRKEPLVAPLGTYRQRTHNVGVGAQEFAFRTRELGPRLRTSIELPWAPLP